MAKRLILADNRPLLANLNLDIALRMHDRIVCLNLGRLVRC